MECKYIANFKWFDPYGLEKNINERIRTGKIIVWKKENETIESFYNRIEEQKYRIFKSGLVQNFDNL